MTQITSMSTSHAPCGYLFDLDGTLVDSLRDITAALNAARSDLGMIPVESNQVRSWVGDGLAALCRRSAPDADNATQTRLVERAAQRYAERPVVDTAPYPNILQLLNLLRARSSALAVLSNKPHALTIEILAHLNLSSYFAVIQGSQREEERKPDPRAALRIAGVGARLRMCTSSVTAIDIKRPKCGHEIGRGHVGMPGSGRFDAAGPDFCLMSL
jgi:phosphoglycolate phosphatase-like HAD superfamily hydrolase